LQLKDFMNRDTWTDPIVEEIHEFRRQISAQHHDDPIEIAQYFLSKQKALPQSFRTVTASVPAPFIAPLTGRANLAGAHP
jgi:glucose-6-phosphate isomerase